jgi:PAS domain S-box-containing protein
MEMPKPLKILLVEDSAADAEILQYMLKKAKLDCIFKVVDNKPDFENGILSFSPDVILSDHSLPGFNSMVGLEICKKLNCEAPFILVTGSVSEEYAAECIKAGADDYILKTTLTRLPSAIENAIRKKSAELEREKSLQKLAMSEKNYRDLFDYNPMPMWIIDKYSFQFIQVNEAAIKHYGYSRKEFLSMNAVDIRPENEKKCFSDIERVSNIGPHKAGVFTHKKKDGSLIKVEITVDDTFIHGAEARLVLANDITEKVNANEKLEEQNRKLLKINSELDRFVYSATHELRAPLTSMLGLLAAIGLESNKEEELKLLNMMHSRIDRLDLIVKDILYYSKNSRLEVEYGKVDLKKIIDQSLDNLSYMEEIKKINLEIIIPGNITFYSDQKRLNILFNNLLSNAFKYHNLNQENPYVRIVSFQKDDSVFIEISDNGIGIPEDCLNKIFDMFFRGTAVKEGSGLGLFIAKEVVDRLGGSIDVESHIQIGTKFQLKFPCLSPATQSEQISMQK